jgi:2-polyprenyl-6-methoxyphenol hydroxylase-like FAD-dependent oxidoreductase
MRHDHPDWPRRGTHAIVVGAGPGGSVTALLLARLGLDVVLLDRTAFPRPKPCGDCLSAAATGLLERLGLLDRVRAAGASSLARWDIIAPGGTVATGRLPGRPALALERRILDAVLLDAARDAGARFTRAAVTDLVWDGRGRVTGVTARAGDRELRLFGRLVVGADGLRSVVARRLGLLRRRPRLRKVSLTAHVPVSPTLAHGEMHVLDGGCIGIARAGPLHNVTLVVAGRHGESLRAMGPDAFFQEWVGRAPAVARRLDSQSPTELLASGPFDWPMRAPVAHGAALVGDAAGYYDPFTGQGIYQAMAAAEGLVASVGPALRADAPASRMDRALATYSRRKERLTRPARRIQRVVEAVVSRPSVADAVLSRLGATAAMDRLLEVTGDLRRPSSLLSAAVISSLVVPPTPEIP